MVLAANATPIPDVVTTPAEVAPQLWVGGESIYFWDGETRTTQFEAPTTEQIYGVWGKPGQIWAVGLEDGTNDPRIYRSFDGVTWNAETHPIGSAIGLTNVWGYDATDVWISAISGQIWRWNNGLWSGPFGSGGGLDFYGSIWGDSPNRIWCVGNTYFTKPGIAWYWNGSTWTQWVAGSPNANYAYNGIWGTSSSNFWIVGNYTSSIGSVHRWNGSTFDLVLRGDGNPGGLSFDNLNRIWGFDANNVWAVGESGDIVYWDGTTWHKQSTASGATNFLGIWGTAADDVYAVGNHANRRFILHYDGRAWAVVHREDITDDYFSCGGIS